MKPWTTPSECHSEYKNSTQNCRKLDPNPVNSQNEFLENKQLKEKSINLMSQEVPKEDPSYSSTQNINLGAVKISKITLLFLKMRFYFDNPAANR